MPSYLITVAGEIPIRSPRTRRRFYKTLIENIKDAVKRSGARVLDYKLAEAKIHLNTDKDVIGDIARVFGVHRVGSVIAYEFKDLDDLASWVYENAKAVVSGRKFAVRVKRSGVHPFTSLDVAKRVGALLKDLSAGVDLENPEVLVEVEVRGSTAYLYKESLRGPGGLPVGVEGKALVLFSGGFDSPIAAWLTAKRGVQVDFLHYVMGPLQPSYYAFIVAKALAEKWLHGYNPQLIAVDFRDIVAEITRKVDWSYRQVVLRALMYFVASRIASSRGYDALVTGESVGQASSQTLRNLSAIERAIKPEIPILRPLLGLDKEEIVEYSKRIGLYELSSKVAEACAIAPTKVATASTPEEIRKYLELVDMGLVERAISSARVVKLLEANPEEILPPDDIEIDFIPEGAIVVDTRNESERSRRPIPSALPAGNVDFTKVPRDKVVVVVCESGTTSYLLAKILREQGIRAYSLRGGARAYCRAL